MLRGVGESWGVEGHTKERERKSDCRREWRERREEGKRIKEEIESGG